MVNGWWAAWGLPSSSMPSKSGKSITHKNRRSPSPTGGRPRSSRSWPSTSQAVRHSSATTRTRSPAPRPVAATMPARSASESTLSSGEVEGRPAPSRCHLEPGQTLGAELLGPLDEGVEPVAAERGAVRRRAAPSRTGRRRPGPRCRRTPSPRSTSSMPKRRSGLSVPKRSMASCHVMRLDGRRALAHRRLGGVERRPRRRRPCTSSWVTNDASMSSWVNSNWRSARRSSSRRQRAIWK